MKRIIRFSNIVCSMFALVTSVTFGQTTFNYTGALQNYIVPAGVNSVQIEAWGAEGGTGTYGGITPAAGLGGYAIGNLAVTPGQTLQIFVGGQGVSTGPGGYNGGGQSGTQYGASGGGASDVRIGAYTLNDRVIVAGGGGGAAYGSTPSDGGHGGGLSGSNGESDGGFTGGGGGTQVAGGAAGCCYGAASAGTFGLGAGPGDYHNAGGGGGWYGGGSGAGQAGAGGGSSYIDGVSGGSTITGVQSGNGQVVISVLCAGLITSVSASEVCDGESVTLSAASPGTGVVTWDNGVIDNVAFYPPIGTTQYTATSSDIGECPFIVDITVNPLPTVDAGADVDLCSGGSDVTLIGAGNADSYSWDNGVIDGVPFTPSIGLTSYVLTGTIISSGCSNSDTVDVVVSSPIVILGNTQDVLFGTDGSIDITVTGGYPPFSFQWDNGAGIGEDPTGLDAGTYTVIVTDSLGCTSTAGYIIYSQVGLDDLNQNVSVYPNPTKDFVTISAQGKFRYELVDLSGQIIMNGEGNISEKLEMKEISSGSYNLRLLTEDQIYVYKIIKQ